MSKANLTTEEIIKLKAAVKDRLLSSIEWLDNKAVACFTDQKIHKEDAYSDHFEMAKCMADDASDFCTVAMLILKGDMVAAGKAARAMDTEPRDYIPESVYKKLYHFM